MDSYFAEFTICCNVVGFMNKWQLTLCRILSRNLPFRKRKELVARVVSNLPRVSNVMPYDFRPVVGRHFVVAGTLSLDLTRQASTLCSRHETILDEKTPIERA